MKVALYEGFQAAFSFASGGGGGGPAAKATAGPPKS